jgi:RING-box protein 2
MADEDDVEMDKQSAGDEGRMFTLKKWNAVAMWVWDVKSDTCPICKLLLMETCLNCQADLKKEECVVVWGECNHSFHLCCMTRWINTSNNQHCPVCHSMWEVQRLGK